MSMPRLRSIGLAPAATDLAPSLTMACASTVAVVVPSPATSEVLDATSLHHLRAHVLELVLELDLLGDGDAVLGDARGAEGLLEHDVAALGPERHLDGIGENVDAAQHALAGVLRELDVFGCHGWLLQVDERASSRRMPMAVERLCARPSPSSAGLGAR